MGVDRTRGADEGARGGNALTGRVTQWGWASSLRPAPSPRSRTLSPPARVEAGDDGALLLTDVYGASPARNRSEDRSFPASSSASAALRTRIAPGVIHE